MRVSAVSFGFTKNLGNFQSMRVDCTVEVREDDSFDNALVLAAAVVKDACDEPLDAAEHMMLEAERRRVRSLAIEEKS